MKYIAIDQYGQHYFIKKFPRKELVEQLCNSHVSKMYRDTKEGAKHVGYVIGNNWLSVYKVSEWKGQ